MDQTLVTNLLFALITAIVGLLAYAGKQLITIGLLYLQKKIGVSEYDLLLKNASTVVRFLSQSPATELWDGAQKKQYAINTILNFAEKMKINVNYDTVDQLIEEAVQVMKTEFEDYDWGLDAYDVPLGQTE